MFILKCMLLVGALSAMLPAFFAFHSPLLSRLQIRPQGQLQMNMAERFFRVVKSNMNSVLSNLEDPEKVLEQAVTDMQKDLVKIRQSYAEISATQKRFIKQKEQADTLAADWYRRAQLALQQGEEELAREALSRRQTQLDQSSKLEQQINAQTASIDKLYTSMTDLDQKILEAKQTKDEFIARARTAKTSVQVNDMLSNIGDSTSTAAFEKMKEKVEALEANAEVMGELSSTSSVPKSLDDRFKALEGGSKVDDELEAMKRQLPAAPDSPAKELPGMLSPEDAAPLSELDAEYEALKKEMEK